jgi:hypothetical protein
MKTRAALVASAVIAAGLAGAASAATLPPAKVCNIIKDGSGDAHPFGVSVAPSAKSLDITSGDVASDGKLTTAVIRVASLGTDPSAPLGQEYTVNFELPGGTNTVFLSYLKTPNTAIFSWGHISVTATGSKLSSNDGAAKGVVDTAKKEIRITVPSSVFALYGKKLVPGSKLTGIAATTYQYNGFYINDPLYAASTPQVDVATAAKSFVVGTASCVTPVK